MTRQRKTKQPASDSVPLVKPSDSSNSKQQKPLIDISEEEQWRLINESGVLKKVSLPDQAASNDDSFEGDAPTFGEEIFNTILYVIPFSFLLIMMEILIHYQYSRRPTFDELSDRMISGIPIISIFIFYSLRYKRYRVMQILFFAVSILSGSRLIYLLNHANWLTNMKQAPPLATIWIYTVVQAELGPAVLALLTVGSFVWWKELKIIL